MVKAEPPQLEGSNCTSPSWGFGNVHPQLQEVQCWKVGIEPPKVGDSGFRHRNFLNLQLSKVYAIAWENPNPQRWKLRIDPPKVGGSEPEKPRAGAPSNPQQPEVQTEPPQVGGSELETPRAGPRMNTTQHPKQRLNQLANNAPDAAPSDSPQHANNASSTRKTNHE